MEHVSQDQIALYAADQLDAAETDRLRAHLRQGCPICAGSLAEAEMMLALLAETVVPIVPPSGAYRRIEAAVGAGKRSTHENLRRFFIGMSSAAVAASIAMAVIWFTSAPARELLRSNDLRLVSLGGSDQQAKAKGRVLWDQEHHRWQVTVFDLTPPPPGKTYELWFITTDQRKLRAATFDTSRDGSATLMVAIPPDIGPLAMAAVTDEPAGGSAQPTGSIQLAGKIPS